MVRFDHLLLLLRSAFIDCQALSAPRVVVLLRILGVVGGWGMAVGGYRFLSRRRLKKSYRKKNTKVVA
jgi:uncharacterized membrane-anchored protein